MIRREAELYRWPTFLRLDRPEVHGGYLVVPAKPTRSRARCKASRAAPLAYLYEIGSEFEPENELRLAVGHYDATHLVWSFSGEVSGLTGITEPTTLR
ncbi:hypothetical protein FE391_23030 [Nonomuraea sp. KC401]|uniref:hypothetical protein n=1 Tax=unclassified Nonomuraea TaxID=2593643 RepID=UPI0010FF1411|nr:MULTISPECIES: hypothetical protein [unclassified Nonomuraea]NBE96319.1 hypothetical protein [Nonomuraea sp. K271]TLF68217.1 hypothetical protein FE391_23030 [Nonomuraea sp. KC401]